jgi:CBS domain-containing protein
MKPIVQILKTKPDQEVHHIGPEASVFEAASLMAHKNIGALLVLDAGQVVGIVTERDIARKLPLASRLPQEMLVGEVMHAPVQCVLPTNTNEECMALMTDKRVRHLPVVDQGKLVGLVSIGDLVKDIISEQEFIIHQLEHYIAGARG